MKHQHLSLLALSAASVSAAPGIQLGEGIDSRNDCTHDNLLRCLIASPSIAIPFCSSSANVLISLPTVTVTVTPTSFVTATHVTTDVETLTDTSIELLTVTPTSIAPETLTSSPPEKRERRKACPAPNCIRALNPQPSSASHGCSCFSGSYLATASTFTSTVTAPAVTKASQTFWKTEISTATVIVTITSETTVLGRSSSSSSSSLSSISTSSVPSSTSTPPAITTTSLSYTTITTYPASCDATRSAIPLCASSCLSSAAVTQARCRANDTICQCQNQDVIQGAGQNCIIGGCGFGGAIDVLNSVSAFCSCEQQGLYTTTAPAFLPPLATTTSAPPILTD